MCGRFTLTKTKQEINDYLYSLSVDQLNDFTPQYNIAPTQQILAIVSINNKWQHQFLGWGLIPRWSKRNRISTKPLINARRETLSEKSSFKDAFVHRRCLILADGFYEWNQHLYQKNPLYFHLENHSIFAFAGLWESWKDSDGRIINSTTIINTSAEGIMNTIHPRMPVVLSPSVYDQWLNSQITTKLDTLLRKHNCNNFSYYPVSEKVNFVKNNYPDLLIKKQFTITEQLSLF
jgi:putative SOS response-associated peptidase YedK